MSISFLFFRTFLPFKLFILGQIVFSMYDFFFKLTVRKHNNLLQSYLNEALINLIQLHIALSINKLSALHESSI